MICTYLIEATRNPAIPGAWLSLAAGIGLAAALITKGRAAAPAAHRSGPAILAE